MDDANSAFLLGRMLNEWRKHRGLTQGDVAGELDISTKHLSFVERGRSGVGRDLLEAMLRLYDVPPVPAEQIIQQAGFSSVGRRSEEADITDAMLENLQQLFVFFEPFPAYILDKRLNVIAYNTGGQRLMDALGVKPYIFEDKFNLLLSLADPQGFRRYFENWPEVLRNMMRRLQHNASRAHDPAAYERIETALFMFPGVREAIESDREERALFGVNNVVLADTEGNRAEFYHITSLFNGPMVDGYSVRYRVESFMPADSRGRKLSGIIYGDVAEKWGKKRRDYYCTPASDDSE